jgi:hypothetical protein
VRLGYEEDPKLDAWINNQRLIFKTGKMDSERERRLGEIGFEFNVKDKAKEETWNLQFKRLRDYSEKYGHCELFWAVDRFTFILNNPLTLLLYIS